jgi:hypothetical protein
MISGSISREEMVNPGKPLTDYDEQQLPWTKRGWLSSVEYYAFWGAIFVSDSLRQQIDGRQIADIGAGNGRIWQAALEQGSKPYQLRLIDPDLVIAPELAARPDVVAQKKTLEEIAPVETDVALFKQSFHLIYSKLGPELFDLVQADTYVTFAMPMDIEWPASEAFMKLYRPTCLDFQKIIAKSGRKIIADNRYGYSVHMHRAEWITMLENRFVSCLGDCSDILIADEIAWALRNLPEELEFSDTLECLVFE